MTAGLLVQNGWCYWSNTDRGTWLAPVDHVANESITDAVGTNPSGLCKCLLAGCFGEWYVRRRRHREYTGTWQEEWSVFHVSANLLDIALVLAKLRNAIGERG